MLGLGVGLLWAWRAPRPQLQVHEGTVRVDNYSETFVAADLTLAWLCTLAGLVMVVVALLWWRRAEIAVVIGGVAGGLVGSCLAWWLGVRVSGGSTTDPAFGVNGRADGTVFSGPLTLGSRGVLLLWPLVFVIVTAVFYGVRSSRARHSLRDRIAVTATDGPPEPSAPQ